MKATIILTTESEELQESNIDLNLTAAQNAKFFFEARAKLKLKEEKTVIATQTSLKKAQQSAIAEIRNKKLQTRKKKVMAHRKPLWFEKFFWFLSSENYLVLTARDAQQNEVLIKKYAKPRDVVFHAHIEGAAFTVIKNPIDKPVPALTIMETATVSLAHSRAWDDKVVIPVYWVHANQVSKSAPTGLYLSTGSFMIYGKKNFVQPFKLEMGFGLMFKIDDENIVKHKNERTFKEDFELTPILEEPVKEIVDREVNKLSALDIIAGDNTKSEITEIQIQKKPKVEKIQAKVKKEKKLNKEEEKIKEKERKEKELKETIIPKNPNKKMSKFQKDKLNKYLEKYGDEDEEEQEMRIKITGIKKNYNIEEGKKTFLWNQLKTKEEYLQEEGELLEIKINKIEDEILKPKTDKKAQVDKATETLKQALIESDIPKDEKYKKEKDKKKELAEAIALVEMEEEGDEDNDFGNLTGMPFKDDCLFEAHPVCAPYSTLLKYKYKIKLIPGNMKRGRVMKLALELFCGQGEVYDKERELIKTIPENVAVLQLLNNCKVQAQGVNKLVKDTKKKAKKSKKEKDGSKVKN